MTRRSDNYASQQNDFIARRQEGTGQWLLDSGEYQTWLQSAKKTLFCPGIPGAGKTILAAIAIDNLTARFQKDRALALRTSISTSGGETNKRPSTCLQAC